jgi:hypothetical protein
MAVSIQKIVQSDAYNALTPAAKKLSSEDLYVLSSKVHSALAEFKTITGISLGIQDFSSIDEAFNTNKDKETLVGGSNCCCTPCCCSG